MPAQDQTRGIFPRARAWLSRRRPRSHVVSAVVLPRSARCFRGALYLRLPHDFVSAQSDSPVLTGRKSGLRLTLMRLPFRPPLRSITPLDLQIAFRRVIPPYVHPELTYGFQRHSPMLTAVWTQHFRERKKPPKTVKTVLRLIQTRGTVFLLLFENVTDGNDVTAEAVLASVTVDAERVR